ncbi:iron-sulfur cluster assembly accessory protein [bacterium]|nr:iron-sulfur cluster assembly accessory protein [bacterium]
MSISDKAAERIQALLAKAEAPVAGLRISVTTKGCSGLSYKVEYADAAKTGDEVINDKGVTVMVDPAAVMFLIGTEMDYVETRVKSGFEFNNPNESGRCGCGESFYVDRDKLSQMKPEAN